MPRQTPSASDYTSVVKSSAVANDVASKPAGSPGAARASAAAVRSGGGLGSLGAIGSIVKQSVVAKSIAPIVHTNRQNVTPIYTYSWSQQSGAPSQRYATFIIDDIGNTAITTSITNISGTQGPFVTIDRGATWTRKATGMAFPPGAATLACCLARSKPSVMYASVESAGYLYKSTNGGDSWTELTSAGLRDWRSIYCDSVGSNIVATAWNSYIHRSTDGGSNWTVLSNSGQYINWDQTFISDDGRTIAGAISGLNIAVSTNGGSNFTLNSSFGNYFWRGLSGSSDGRVLFAGHLNGAALSKDSGATWVDITSSIGGTGTCSNTAVSADGSKLATAKNNGNIYVSQDGGTTWVTQTSAGTSTWEGIGINATGTTIIAGPSNAGRPWVGSGS